MLQMFAISQAKKGKNKKKEKRWLAIVVVAAVGKEYCDSLFGTHVNSLPARKPIKINLSSAW